MTSNKTLLSLYMTGLCFWLVVTVANNLSAFSYEHSPEALLHLKTAKQYLDQGKFSQAKIELETALELNPKSPDILNNLGVIYIRLSESKAESGKIKDDLSKAKTYISQALSIDPDFPAAWNSLADVYYLSGENGKAISYYKKALSLSPVHPFELQTNLANALRDSGLLQEALEHYLKAIDLNPLYAPAHNGYAELLYSKQDYGQAYDEAIEAIKLKPDYATAYYHLGLIQTARDQRLDALKAYMLSLRYEKHSNYAQQTQTLVNQLGIDTNTISKNDLDQYQTKLWQSSSASAPVQESNQSPSTTIIKPPVTQITSTTTNNNQYSIEAIQALMADRKWEQAYEELLPLIKTHPNDPLLLNEMGLVLFSQKKYSSAEKFLRKSILYSQNKFNAAYYNLGQVYLKTHNLTKAQQYLEKAKTLAKRNHRNCALINNTLAIVLKQKGDLIGAQSAYLQAIADGGNNYPVFHYNLAILLEQMHKTKEAANEFNLYLHLAPNGLNAKNAQDHLKKI